MSHRLKVLLPAAPSLALAACGTTRSTDRAEQSGGRP